MADLIRLVGPNRAVEILGVKLLVSVLFVVLLVWLAKGLRAAGSPVNRGPMTS